MSEEKLDPSPRGGAGDRTAGPDSYRSNFEREAGEVARMGDDEVLIDLVCLLEVADPEERRFLLLTARRLVDRRKWPEEDGGPRPCEIRPIYVLNNVNTR